MRSTVADTGKTNKVVRSLAVAKLLRDGRLVYLLLVKIKEPSVICIPYKFLTWPRDQNGRALITLVKIN
jgi:hypothetical protein